MVNATPRPLYPRERDPVPIVQEAGWALGPVWTGAENLTPIGIRSSDRTAHSESLYRLSYPGPQNKHIAKNDPLKYENYFPKNGGTLQWEIQKFQQNPLSVTTCVCLAARARERFIVTLLT